MILKKGCSDESDNQNCYWFNPGDDSIEFLTPSEYTFEELIDFMKKELDCGTKENESYVENT